VFSFDSATDKGRRSAFFLVSRVGFDVVRATAELVISCKHIAVRADLIGGRQMHYAELLSPSHRQGRRSALGSPSRTRACGLRFAQWPATIGKFQNQMSSSSSRFLQGSQREMSEQGRQLHLLPPPLTSTHRIGSPRLDRERSSDNFDFSHSVPVKSKNMNVFEAKGGYDGPFP
jgi:hypothetical protein